MPWCVEPLACLDMRFVACCPRTSCAGTSGQCLCPVGGHQRLRACAGTSGQCLCPVPIPQYTRPRPPCVRMATSTPQAGQARPPSPPPPAASGPSRCRPPCRTSPSTTASRHPSERTPRRLDWLNLVNVYRSCITCELPGGVLRRGGRIALILCLRCFAIPSAQG